MPIYKRCKTCNEEFAVTPSLADKREFCSVKCRGKSQSTRIEKNCSVCGKLFEIQARRKDAATCSKECGYAARKVKKICVVCGDEFHVPKSRESTAKACSNECARSVRADSTKRRIILICECCGKEFEEARSHADRRRFCSMDCRDSSVLLKEEQSRRVAGSLNPMWKGGIVKQSDGYLYKHVTEHPFVNGFSYILEHRLVIEGIMQQDSPKHEFMISIYGKPYLRPEIQVHHIDCDKSNNDPSNLIAVTVAAHRRIHAGLTPKPGTYWPETTEIFIKSC